MQSTGKVTIITAVAKKRVQPEKDKGELMENNVDLMEVQGYWEILTRQKIGRIQVELLMESYEYQMHVDTSYTTLWIKRLQYFT